MWSKYSMYAHLDACLSNLVGHVLLLWACTEKERAWEANAIGIKTQIYRSVWFILILLFPYLCKFPVACKSRNLILDQHFLDILSTSKNYCMFCNICSYEIIQKNEDQPENVSTMRKILGTSQYLYVATQRDPIDLVNLLRFVYPGC
jgi:hypothetical protein